MSCRAYFSEISRKINPQMHFWDTKARAYTVQSSVMLLSHLILVEVAPQRGAFQLLQLVLHDMRCFCATVQPCSAQICSELTCGPWHGAPLAMTDVNILLMSRGGKYSPSSQLLFWSPAFTFPDTFLGEPELLLVVVLFCKSMSSLAD